MKCPHSKTCKNYDLTSYTCNCEQIKENGIEYCGISRKKSYKSLGIFLIFTLILLVSLSSVLAVECNADLSQGGNSCTVSSSLGGYYE